MKLKPDEFIRKLKLNRPLPNKVTVIGDLHLKPQQRIPYIYKMPEALIVKGDLMIKYGCQVELPKILLEVRGRFAARNNKSIQYLPKHLLVSDVLDLDGCSNLKALPNNLSLVHNCYLDNCTSLKKLPKNFKVGHHLYIQETNLKFLPPDLEVGLIICDHKWIQKVPRENLPLLIGYPFTIHIKKLILKRIKEDT